MTKRFLKKSVTSLINNSFIENLLPPSTHNNNDLDRLKDAAGLSQFGQRTKMNSVVRSAPYMLFYFGQRPSISQRIRKAERDIIKQFVCQYRDGVDSTQKDQAVKADYINTCLSAYRDLNQQDHEQLVLSTVEKKSAHNLGKKKSDLPGGVLLSMEQIRNAILLKRSHNRSESAPYKLKPIRPFSEFKKQLYESRKVRILYGNLARKDLHKSVKKAKRMQGSFGENLLLVLETRLDVTLYRCDFFPTVFAARQSIIHNRIRVNSVTRNVPSYQMQAGDIIKVLNQQSHTCQDSIALNAPGKRLYQHMCRLMISQPRSMRPTNQFESGKESGCVERRLHITCKLCYAQLIQSTTPIQSRPFQRQFVHSHNSHHRRARDCALHNRLQPSIMSFSDEALIAPNAIESLQWQYVASADVLWFLSTLQCQAVATILIQNELSGCFYGWFCLQKGGRPGFIQKALKEFTVCKLHRDQPIQSDLRDLLDRAEHEHNLYLFIRNDYYDTNVLKILLSQLHWRLCLVGIGFSEYNLHTADKFDIAHPQQHQFTHKERKKSESLGLCSDGGTQEQLLEREGSKHTKLISKVADSLINGNQWHALLISPTRLSTLIDRVRDLCKKSNPLHYVQPRPVCAQHNSPSVDLSIVRARGTACTLLRVAFYTFCYWSFVKKNLISASRNAVCTPPSFTGDAVKREMQVDMQASMRSRQHLCGGRFYKSHSKPHHLEVSYQNLYAIFLYMPQRIYLPACIDFDLLMRRWGG